MTTIADLLPPDNVLLELDTSDWNVAIERVAGTLRTDPQVLDWEKLYAGLRTAAPCAAERGCDYGICLPHARTDAVSGMVMSVGRSPQGLVFPSCSQVIRYVFCIGVPKALDTDYLRIVGLLVRILKNPQTEAELRAATSASAFIDALARFEPKL